MTGIPVEDKERRLWLLRVHEHAVTQFREAHDLVGRNNRHEDSMILWLIGLAGGAIYLAVDVIIKFALPVGPIAFFISVLPWSASAFCGLVARLKHAKTVLADDKLFLIKAAELSGLPLQKNLDDVQLGIEIILAFGPVKKEGTTKELQEQVVALASSASGWAEACKTTMAVGVLWFPSILVLLMICSWGR